MTRYIDMSQKQRSRVWEREAAARKDNAELYISGAELEVNAALRRWAQDPESAVRQTLLKDAVARLDALKAEFGR